MVERREQRRQLVHDEVRAAAIAHMSLRGFDGVTVEEIAATTSVSASTIYRHFGTKEALVLTPGRPSAVVGRFADDTKRDTPDAMRRAVNKVYGKDDDVPAELRLVVGNAGLLDQFHREWRAADAGLAEALAARARRSEPALADRAGAAALLAASAVAVATWAADGPDDKLRPHLDEALGWIG